MPGIKIPTLESEFSMGAQVRNFYPPRSGLIIICLVRVLVLGCKSTGIWGLVTPKHSSELRASAGTGASAEAGAIAGASAGASVSSGVSPVSVGVSPGTRASHGASGGRVPVLPVLTPLRHQIVCPGVLVLGDS